MARYFILALLVIFAICLMQVSAAPQEEVKETNFPDELKKAGEKITQAFNDAKPKLDELLAKGQEFLQDIGKKISEEAGKMIPKNAEENKS